MRYNQLNRFGRHTRLSKLSGIPLALMVCGSVFAQPANDECDTAEVLPGSAPFPPYTTSVDATDATSNPADPQLSCNNDDGTQTVWYVYTPDASGWVDLNTVGSATAGGDELDTAHGAFTGSCGDLVEVACVDSGLNDNLNVNVEAGTTYYIKVGQYAGGSDAGTVVMNVEEGREPIPPQKLVIESKFNGTTAPLRDLVARPDPEAVAAARASTGLEIAREVPNRLKMDEFAAKADSGVYGSAVNGRGRVRWNGPADLLQVFEGGTNDDNWDVLGTLIAPPDTVGDVGKDHYIQMYNLLTEIFDKEGNTVFGPIPTSAFFGALWEDSWCAYLDDGDPIVLYDEETDRWLVSQFLASFQDGLCIAVSTSGDPLGSWNAYEFDFTGIGFPDYPKYGFATDAINVMLNIFDPFQGSALGAIDKAEMLAGDPATMVLFTGGEAAQLLFGWVPGDNDGPVFDNTLPTFFTGPPFLSDLLVIAELTPDWQAPEETGISFSIVPVSPYDISLCDDCVPQPGVGTTEGGNEDLPESTQVIAALDSLSSRLMHRGQTRDYGKRKIAMLSHTVDADGSGKAGVRWYELVNHKDRGWTLKKEGTYSPDGDSRWMGSVAMTASGDTCLGYSISSESTYPSIGVTGRKGTSNHMNIKEVVAYDGNETGGVQRGVSRWGDYSSMNIDPVDDTCWYTQEAPRPNQALIPGGPFEGIPFGEYFGWGTHVIHFDVSRSTPQ